MEEINHIGGLRPDPQNRLAYNPCDVGMIEDTLIPV